MKTIRNIFTAIAGISITGCAELHSSESALNPAGTQASAISKLTWLFTGVCVVVYVLVILFLFGSMLHRRRGKATVPDNEPLEPTPEEEKPAWRVVLTCIGVTTVVLFGLLIADFATGRSLHVSGKTSDVLQIKIVGHQWWWEITYLDWPERYGEKVPSNGVVTANEIHVPVDSVHPVTLQLLLESHDVNHSFWLPNLSGKKDLIPGHPTELQINVTTPGTYWGECAEYCGYQHANMRLVLVAESAEQFHKWLDNQRNSANEPSSESAMRGKEVFLHSSCVMCHNVSGTLAKANLGPNLTHVASRKILAAGAIQNNRGNLAGWLADPQQIKPGTQMPSSSLTSDDLQSLLDYLRGLK